MESYNRADWYLQRARQEQKRKEYLEQQRGDLYASNGGRNFDQNRLRDIIRDVGHLMPLDYYV